MAASPGPSPERAPGYAAIAGLSETVGVAALYRGLAIGMMSIVAPVGAAAPVVPVVVGIVLGEFPTPIQGASIVLAVTGIAITSWGRPSGGVAATGLASSISLGLLAALGFGSFFVAKDAASEGGVPWALLVARLTAVTLFTAVMFLRRAPLAVRGAELPGTALIGVLIVGADSMYAIASTQGLLGVVAVLSSLYPVVTIGLARVYLRERIERLRQIGIAMCLGGVVAISGASGGGFAEIDPHEVEQQKVSAAESVQTLAEIRTLGRLSSEAVISDGGVDQNVKSAASGQEMEDH